jgi:predicted RecA/RadA family phage recombinase
VSSGDIVKVGTNNDAILCVALVDIANGASGSLGYNCEVAAPKVSAAVFNQGESLNWDVSAGAFDDNAATPATGDVSGAASRAEADGANTETTCRVWLTGIPSTVT